MVFTFIDHEVTVLVHMHTLLHGLEQMWGNTYGTAPQRFQLISSHHTAKQTWYTGIIYFISAIKLEQPRILVLTTGCM